ncbi:Sds3-like-domain-containing protein [Mycotypha africana]|uniref:Sds3-like-domain-containing protein n=1 Tax=Mycotypha africana TaxID=64632 RepID=UPI002300E06C|nr:Sds3-like-domain-containing protein [Mycotypha africana]KAI8981716.1 Sds3-like-domain-containing protein [Mycotypha africana]
MEKKQQQHSATEDSTTNTTKKTDKKNEKIATGHSQLDDEPSPSPDSILDNEQLEGDGPLTPTDYISDEEEDEEQEKKAKSDDINNEDEVDDELSALLQAAGSPGSLSEEEDVPEDDEDDDDNNEENSPIGNNGMGIRNAVEEDDDINDSASPLSSVPEDFPLSQSVSPVSSSFLLPQDDDEELSDEVSQHEDGDDEEEDVESEAVENEQGSGKIEKDKPSVASPAKAPSITTNTTSMTKRRTGSRGSADDDLSKTNKEDEKDRKHVQNEKVNSHNTTGTIHHTTTNNYSKRRVRTVGSDSDSDSVEKFEHAAKKSRTPYSAEQDEDDTLKKKNSKANHKNSTAMVNKNSDRLKVPNNNHMDEDHDEEESTVSKRGGRKRRVSKSNLDPIESPNRSIRRRHSRQEERNSMSNAQTHEDNGAVRKAVNNVVKKEEEQNDSHLENDTVSMKKANAEVDNDKNSKSPTDTVSTSSIPPSGTTSDLKPANGIDNLSPTPVAASGSQVEEQQNKEEGGHNAEEASEQRDVNDSDYHQRHKEAFNALLSIEIEFARLRDKMYNEKMEELNEEAHLIADGTHPDLMTLMAEIEEKRNKRISNAEAWRRHQHANYRKQFEGFEYQANIHFISQKNALRRALIETINNKKWSVDDERAKLNDLTRADCHRLPNGREMVLSKKEKKEETADLQDTKDAIGFPMAPRPTGLNPRDVDEDMKLLGIPRQT